MKNLKLSIIGRGNVASHLHNAFQAVPDIESIMVNPHTLEELDPEADITIISVSDNAITEVLTKLPATKSILAHTSGSTSIDVFADREEHSGVFYPFQTFSKDKALDYSTIPFFIEASDTETETSLLQLASRISGKVYVADSRKRRAMHIAGVFACNFANHLWAIADRILNDNDMDFEVLRPLLMETLSKTETMRPHDGQTGPAVRNDSKTINSHLEFLKESDADQEIIDIYNHLSKSISLSHSDSSTSK